MFCPKCGAQVRDGAKFCPKCGNTIAEASTPNGFKNATAVTSTSTSTGTTSISVGNGDIKYFVFIGVAVLQLLLWNVGGFSFDFSTITKYLEDISYLFSDYSTILSQVLGSTSMSFGALFTKVPQIFKQISSIVSLYGSYLDSSSINIPDFGYMTTLNVFFYILVIVGAALCVYAFLTKKELIDCSIVPCVASLYVVIVALVTSSKVKDLFLTYLYSSDIASLNFGGILLIIVSLACIAYGGLQLFNKYAKK